MFRTLDDFYRTYTMQSEGTVKLLAALTDESLGVRATTGSRSLGETAWHIVVSITEMMNRTDLILKSMILLIEHVIIS